MIAPFFALFALAAAPSPPPAAPPPSEPSSAPAPAPTAPAPAPTAPTPPATPAPSAASAAPAKPKGGEQLLEETVAWINDDVILWSELREQEQSLVAQAVDANRKAAPDELSRSIKEIRDKVLMQMISNRLLVQEAERLYNMDEVKKDIIKRFKEQKQLKTDEDVDRLISQWGMTRAELEDRLLLASVPDYVLDMQVLRNIAVSSAEVRQYYDDHKAQFTTPARVTFREIVLMSKDPAQRAARKADAERVVARARGGEAFPALVKELSEAPSKALEGKIGPVSPGDLIPEIAQAVEQTPVGQVTDPIETAQGWHVLKIEERQDAQVTPFDAARAECEQAVRQAKSGPTYEEYMKGLWKGGTIEVRKSYLDRIPAEWRSFVTTKD